MNLTDEHDDQADELAPARTLPGNHVLVHLEGLAEPLNVRVTNRDRIAWDRTAPKKKWGAASDVPNLALTFYTWNAARRDGLTDLSLTAWESAVEHMEDVEDEATASARPTQKGRQPGS